MSAAGRALSKALDILEDWTFNGGYAIKHMPSGQEFWVANGAWFFDAWDEIKGGKKQLIGLIERHRLYFKARKIVAKYELDRRNLSANDLIARFKAAQK